MILKIITPDQDEITKNHIDSVNVHLSNGYPISIYPRHIPLAAALQAGFINYSENGIKNMPVGAVTEQFPMHNGIFIGIYFGPDF